MKFGGFLIILSIFLLIGVGSAKIIEMPKQTYQDWQGNTYILDAQNISTHPLYSITETASDYTITRQGETFNLKKSEADFDFQYDRIIPNSRNLNGKKPFVLTYDEKVFKNNNGKLKSQKWTWNPEAEISDEYVKVSENDNRKERIEIVKGNIANGKITYNLPEWSTSLKEHTIVVSNATTSEWTTSNISMVNATKDLSSGNITVGYIYDTFEDNIISNQYITFGTYSENSGILNLSNNAGASYPLLYKDNFNASVDMKTVVNGSSSWQLASFFYLINYSTTGTNYSNVFVGNDNKTKNEITYRGIQDASYGSTNHNKFGMNTYKVNTYGSTTDLYFNNTFDLTFTNANISNVKSIADYGRLYAQSNSVANFDNLRYWINNIGEIYIYNQKATTGTYINRTRLVIFNNSLTIDLYSRTNGTSVWNLTKSDVANNTWYNIPESEFATDFKIVLNGNSSSAPIFSYLEWDEFNNVITFDPIPNFNVHENELISFTAHATDLNGDSFTYYTNASKGTLNPITGQYSYTTTIHDGGTYYWAFYAVNYYGGIASQTIVVIDPLTPPAAAFVSNCQSISSFISSLMPIFGLGLMIISFVLILNQFKGFQSGEAQINPTAIISGILVGIIGFAMLTIGNYVLYAITGVTGC